MQSTLLGGLVIIALAAAGDVPLVRTQSEPMPASSCRKAAPNYVGSVGVTAWDAQHRQAGVKVWIDPAMASILDAGGTSLRWRIANRLSRWDAAHIPRVRAIVASREDSDISFVYGLTPLQPGIDGTTSRTLVDGSFTTGAQIQLNTLGAMGFQADVSLEAALLDDVASSALHEFGHALGINGHSPSRSDMMFVDSSGEACGPACGPTKADRNTLSYLACRAVENGSGWATN